MEFLMEKSLAGKSIKKDKKKGKSTLISLIGYKKAYNYSFKLKKNILIKLSKHIPVAHFSELF